MKHGFFMGGRAIVRDASIRKTKVATFVGGHFVAEREGEALIVYAIADENGVPGVQANATDGECSALREFNQRMRERYSR